MTHVRHVPGVFAVAGVLAVSSLPSLPPGSAAGVAVALEQRDGIRVAALLWESEQQPAARDLALSRSFVALGALPGRSSQAWLGSARRGADGRVLELSEAYPLSELEDGDASSLSWTGQNFEFSLSGTEARLVTVELTADPAGALGIDLPLSLAENELNTGRILGADVRVHVRGTTGAGTAYGQSRRPSEPAARRAVAVAARLGLLTAGDRAQCEFWLNTLPNFRALP